MRLIPIQSACYAAVLCWWLSSAPRACATSTDLFSTDNANWAHVGDTTTAPTWHSSGGNPNGYISIDDAAEGQGDFFVAPSKYLGNQSGALGQTLQFDLLLSDASAGPSSDVVLVGNSGNTTLIYVYPTQPTASVWQHETLTLGTSDPNWHLTTTTGAAPTQTDFQNAFASLSTLEILGDFHAGTETVGLDNVLLITVPEPSSLGLLFACATLSLGSGRRRWNR